MPLSSNRQVDKKRLIGTKIGKTNKEVSKSESRITGRGPKQFPGLTFIKVSKASALPRPAGPPRESYLRSEQSPQPKVGYEVGAEDSFRLE